MRAGAWTLFLLAILLVSAPAPAQEQDPAESSNQPKQVTVELELSDEALEEIAWKKLLATSGTSPVDYARALEHFLEQFPDTQRRPEIERSLVQNAIEMRDRERIIRFGVPVVEREPENLLFIEHVTRALLATDDPDNAERALFYATTLEHALRALELQQPEGAGTHEVNFRERIDRGIAKALVFQSRANGNRGNFERALELARASFDQLPTAEAAREAGRWLLRLDRKQEALVQYANAFTIKDPDNFDRFREGDRERLGKIYRELHGSEAGLGDLILAAYDRMAAVVEQRRDMLREIDPNLDLTEPTEFTLSGLDGASIDLSSLLGKIVVLDFWATWCQPCRVQQPLYEEVKEKYRHRDDVVFLNVNTDRDRAIVQPFLEEQQWDKTVYFEDGLQRILDVTSIPTTVILDRDGKVASKMIGFDPNRFVEMLSDRIDRTLGEFVNSADPVE